MKATTSAPAKALAALAAAAVLCLGMLALVGCSGGNDAKGSAASSSSAADTNDPDSATSTFFVTLGDNKAVGPALDGKYAAFGTIDEAGMAIVKAIVADHLAAATGQMGTIPDEADQPKILSIEMVD